MANNLHVSVRDQDASIRPSTEWNVEASQPVSYNVRVTWDVLDPSNPSLIQAGAQDDRNSKRRFLVVDSAINELYGGRLRDYLKHHESDYRICVLNASEENKSLKSVTKIIEALDTFGIDRRREPIIGIGGGVLLDIVGLASSLYRRRTPYVRVPTTLIGLVDAGVGVKTGVNFNGHKNRLGTYEPPSAVLLDRSFLATVDRRHISNGLAEMLKIGLIKDGRLFDRLEKDGATLLGEKLQGKSQESEMAAREVLRRSVQGMLEELQPNLWETHLERLVDYGHSFSPSVEMAALPELLHGEAVSLDMALTTHISHRRALVSTEDRDRVLRVMSALELPTAHEACTVDLLAKALADTTRHRDGLQRLPLPVGIGKACFVNDLTAQEIAAAVAEMTNNRVSSSAGGVR